MRGELLLGTVLSLCMIGVGWRAPEIGPYEVWWMAFLTVAALPQCAAAPLGLMATLQRPDRQSGESEEEWSEAARTALPDRATSHASTMIEP